MRTIIVKNDAQGRLRWFCEKCGAQVQGVTTLTYSSNVTHVLYGPCSCAGWTTTDNPTLAETTANLMQEGLAVNP